MQDEYSGCQKNSLRSAITDVFSMLVTEYPMGFQVDKDGSRLKLWQQLLWDVPPEAIRAAALHMIATRKSSFPPDISELRGHCITLRSGRLTKKTGAEAWERIWKLVTQGDNCEINLTGKEKRALARTAPTSVLKVSTNIQADRARFIRAYEEMVEHDELLDTTLPEVKLYLMSRIEEKIDESDNKQIATELKALVNRVSR